MSPKWQEGQQTELPDDEPLSAEDMAHIEEQRIRGRAALINRAASQGMTPMELFASGQVTAEAPDDALAFDKSRQLPAAEEHPAISDEQSSSEAAVVPAERPNSELKARMEEWLKKDGGRSFREGFESYFDGRPPQEVVEQAKAAYNTYIPRAGEDEAVPPTSYDEVFDTPWEGVKIQMHPPLDDEVAEGELLAPVIPLRPDPDEDIVDAEVVEDGSSEGPG